jgi:trigger factor
VTDDQLTQAIVSKARMMPGQEQRVRDYYRNNPNALAALRAPLFEDKVIDFLLELVEVTDKQVSREELFKDDEDEAAAAGR